MPDSSPVRWIEVTYPDRPTGIRMLLNDRADLMMGDSGGGAYTVKLYPNDLESGYVILTDYKVGPGISKSLPELRRAISLDGEGEPGA